MFYYTGYVAHFHPLKSNSCRFQNVILIKPAEIKHAKRIGRAEGDQLKD